MLLQSRMPGKSVPKKTPGSVRPQKEKRTETFFNICPYKLCRQGQKNDSHFFLLIIVGTETCGISLNVTFSVFEKRTMLKAEVVLS